MPEYQLELKQLVDYPRCRIYRQFIKSLIADRNLHSHGGYGLFYIMVLCSNANFRSSYQRIERVSYLNTRFHLCSVIAILQTIHLQ